MRKWLQGYYKTLKNGSIVIRTIMSVSNDDSGVENVRRCFVQEKKLRA